MRILKENTAAVVIDLQARLYPYIHEHQKLTKNNEILIQGLKTLDIPILVTQQYTKGLGATIPEIQKVLGEHEVIEKSSFSCCDDKIFMEELKALNKKQVIISGIEAHVCVMQTVTDLLIADFQPVLVADCISSRNPEHKKIAIERMQNQGAIITTYESVLFELLRYSGTDEFKQISKLVK